LSAQDAITTQITKTESILKILFIINPF